MEFFLFLSALKTFHFKFLDNSIEPLRDNPAYYCEKQDPGSSGTCRPKPANGAAATPLWFSKHLKRANLAVTSFGFLASLSNDVHSLSSL